MPDLATISAALGSIKSATEIVKFLRESDISLEKAEYKLKLAELLGALADAKIELVEVQETLLDKEKKIADLEQAFENKNSLVRNQDGYYELDANGEATGIPYCLRCWENDHKKRQLVRSAKELRTYVCTSCGHQYNGNHVYEIRPQITS